MRPASHSLKWIAGLLLVLVVLMVARTGRRAQVISTTSTAAALSPAAAPFVTPRAPAPPRHGTVPGDLIARLEGRRSSESPAILIPRLLDATQPEKARAAAAEDLARLGTEEAMSALKSVLAAVASSPTLKAAVAEALGRCPHRDARALILELAENADETIARGAMRGLAALDDSAALGTLVSFLNNEQKPAGVRGEAALGLGTMENPEAFTALQAAFHATADPALTRDILEGAGHRPFTETRDFFTGLLQDQNTPGETRVAALEAIGHSPGDATPFLLSYAMNPDPQARAAAAWALAFADHENTLARPLVGLLKSETEPAVRTRLYEALAKEPQFEASTVQQMVEAETDATARLAGFNALARTTAAPEGAQYSDERAVPELPQTALHGRTLPHRLAAVTALQRARTPAARAALAVLTQSSADPRVLKAAQGALTPLRASLR